MKGIKAISLILGIFVIVGMLAVFGVNGSKAAGSPPADVGASPEGAAPGGEAAAAGAMAGPSSELGGSYLLDILAPENAGDKTLYIKKSEDGKVSATWECTEHGFQKLTNVSFDGEVLKFNALSGTPGDEYFYYHLELIGGYLLGYCKTQEGPRSPVLGTLVE